MEKSYIRSLIKAVGGSMLPGESTKEYLVRVSLCAGVGFSSLRAAYYGQDIGPNIYISDNTREKLEQAAENARQTQWIIASTEHQISIWETEPDRFAAHIDAAREFLGRLRQSPEELGETSFCLRNPTGEE